MKEHQPVGRKSDIFVNGLIAATAVGIVYVLGTWSYVLIWGPAVP